MKTFIKTARLEFNQRLECYPFEIDPFLLVNVLDTYMARTGFAVCREL